MLDTKHVNVTYVQYTVQCTAVVMRHDLYTVKLYLFVLIIQTSPFQFIAIQDEIGWLSVGSNGCERLERWGS